MNRITGVYSPPRSVAWAQSEDGHWHFYVYKSTLKLTQTVGKDVKDNKLTVKDSDGIYLSARNEEWQRSKGV